MKDRSAHDEGSTEVPKDESPIAQEEDAGETENKWGFDSASEEAGGGLEQSGLVWVWVFLFLFSGGFGEKGIKEPRFYSQ